MIEKIFRDKMMAVEAGSKEIGFFLFVIPPININRGILCQGLHNFKISISGCLPELFLWKETLCKEKKV